MLLFGFQILEVEDPVTSSNIPVDDFFSLYQTMLSELDGMDMDMKPFYWFEPNPVNTSILRFVSRTRRDEWIDWAIAADLLPPLDEICASESRAEKKEREQRERERKEEQRRIQQYYKSQQPKKSQSESIQVSVTLLEERISKAGCEKERQKLIQKRERALQRLVGL